MGCCVEIWDPLDGRVEVGMDFGSFLKKNAEIFCIIFATKVSLKALVGV